MALPIRDTPVLTGEDARRFLEAIKNPKKISEEERARILASYEKMKSIEKNNLK